MSKFTLELNIKELIEKMPMNKRIELVRELEKETWAKRLDQVVKRIRKHFRRHPLSFRKITRICEEVRQQRYERTKRSH